MTCYDYLDVKSAVSKMENINLTSICPQRSTARFGVYISWIYVETARTYSRSSISCALDLTYCSKPFRCHADPYKEDRYSFFSSLHPELTFICFFIAP